MQRSAKLGNSVAIIGAGALGLVATKNFVEEGFDVTTFEKNSYIGGLWHVTSNSSETSVLEDTICNVSKQSTLFSDFPMPDAYPTHPNANHMQQYLEAYAEHFVLHRQIRLSTVVIAISRDKIQSKWVITTKSTEEIDSSLEVQVFDRLVIGTGPNSKAYIPDVRGIEAFRGDVLHSKALKSPSKYKEKTVLVVGISNPAADSISFLIRAGAKKVYVSHRRKFITVPRMVAGKALDRNLTFRLQLIGFWMQWLAPAMQAKMMTKMLTSFQNQEFPSLTSHPCQNDSRGFPPEDLADHLPAGRVKSVQAIDQISGPAAVKLIDGEELQDVDAILFCTGLHADLAQLLPECADPCNPSHAPELYGALPPHVVEQCRVYRMYRGFLSLQYPHSLAFLRATMMIRAAFPFYDLVSMALAQLWSGKHPMPSASEINANADAHLQRLAKVIREQGDVQHPGSMRQIELDQWLQRVAGTGLYENVGNFGWRAWRLWWNEPKLYRMLMDGPISSHSLRLFEMGGRRAWPGAKKAIIKANEDVERLRREYETSKSKTT